MKRNLLIVGAFVFVVAVGVGIVVLIQALRPEEDERKTGYFHTPAFDHLRLDACESCKHYLKTVDLTKLGLAVPLVDEVAGAPLDLWARERGYEKIELNLLGL